MLIHPDPLRRAECPRCMRPVSTCICGLAPVVPTSVDLLILQHPLEVHNPKGTARLLHMSVPGSSLVTGEVFGDAVLEPLLFGDERQSVLLYPAEEGEAVVLSPAELQMQDVRLVLLDGTWRKTRKMLAVNPLLAALPRLVLKDVPAPGYGSLRRAHAEHQLSTIEAAAYALAELDPHFDKDPLLSAFERLVDMQSEFFQR
jgi:DTW domain-containing protein YfiP